MHAGHRSSGSGHRRNPPQATISFGGEYVQTTRCVLVHACHKAVTGDVQPARQYTAICRIMYHRQGTVQGTQVAIEVQSLDSSSSTDIWFVRCYKELEGASGYEIDHDDQRSAQSHRVVSFGSVLDWYAGMQDLRLLVRGWGDNMSVPR